MRTSRSIYISITKYFSCKVIALRYELAMKELLDELGGISSSLSLELRY